MASPKEDVFETRRIDGETIQIWQLVWPDGRLSYDVYLDTEGQSECMTMDGSFDTVPTDEQVRALLSSRFRTVKLHWREEVLYDSRVRVDLNKVREWLAWLADKPEANEADADAELTPDIIKRYLDEHQEEWFEACDTDNDFMMVQERNITDLSLD